MRLLLAAAAAALLATTAGAAAPAAPTEAATTPWSALPDWSGVWGMIGNTVFDHATATPGGAGTAGVREHPPYNAAWEAKYLHDIELVKQDLMPDPLSYCGILSGTPRMFNHPDGYEWAITPTAVWMLGENGGQRRIIYTDGRPHLKGAELKPSYAGDNIGHWEGDTLVIDTIGLMDDALLDRTGARISSKAHVVQRVRRIDENTLEAQIDIEDPGALTKPWHVVKRFRKLPKGTYIFDYVCEENNRNPVDERGRTITLDQNGKPLHD
jgi:hypothetical protein